MEPKDKSKELVPPDGLVISPEEKQMKEYDQLVNKYLEEAAELFGPAIKYNFEGVTYHNGQPQVILSESYFVTTEKAYVVKLNGNAIKDRKDGIFQLSHEAVHLLSPVEQVDNDEVNYLEEGMATWFSKKVTERETGDMEYCEKAIEKNEKYKKAFELFEQLLAIDKEAVKSLRKHSPVIAQITAADFEKAGIKASKELIEALLQKF